MSAARPPVTAESRTLASATSRTARLAPRLEGRVDVALAQTATPELPPNLRAENRKQLALQLDRQGDIGCREEDASGPTASRDEDGILRAQQLGCAVTEVTHAANPHVVTTATIVYLDCPTSRSHRCRAPRESRLLVENVEVQKLRTVDHSYDDDPAPRDPENRAVRRVHEMSIFEVEIQCLGNDRAPLRPLLETRNVSLDAVEPGRSSRKVVPSDVGVDRRDVALRRPRNVNAVSSRHDGGL